jgi:DNA segregation ATPase FtsK/SpoIIIE-like protein
MLQRNVKVSFSQATAIIERMYDEGIVGPQLPSGRREILVTRNREAGHAES